MNRILFFIGMALFLVPLGIRVIVGGKQKDLVSTYEGQWEQTDKNRVEECVRDAVQYNKALYEKGIINSEEYEEQLNLLGNGVMCSLEIPKIDLKLPVYHGTEDEVLSNSIGHMKQTSLPIGGANTHCVLSGHRGLPNAELFTRLDEMEKGDLIFVTVCNQKLGYEVREITVVDPENIDCIRIENNEDLLSLVTCTPYGLNTHRLVITGQRIMKWDTEKVENGTKEIAKRDKLYLLIPCVFALLIGLKKLRKKIPLLLCLMLCFWSTEASAAENAIEIQFPEDYRESVLCTRIGDKVGEAYVLRSEYQEIGIDLNRMKTAKQLRDAAIQISGSIETSILMPISKNGYGKLTDLEDGVYLIHSESAEESKFQPVLVYLPAETKDGTEPISTISIIPKVVRDENIPDTGQTFFEGPYVILALVSMATILVQITRKFSFKK